MKKTFLIILVIFLSSCANETIENNCFNNLTVNEVLNLNNPQFIDLQIAAANVFTTLPQSKRKVIIIKRSPTNIKVFDLECPNRDCTTPMTFDGLKLKCMCNQEIFNSLNGAPLDKGSCFALEYNVQTSGNMLRITR